MTLEVTDQEAKILIAVLTYAEGSALVDNPSIVEALKVLRPWRSALLQAFLHARWPLPTAEAPRSEQG